MDDAMSLTRALIVCRRLRRDYNRGENVYFGAVESDAVGALVANFEAKNLSKSLSKSSVGGGFLRG